MTSNFTFDFEMHSIGVEKYSFSPPLARSFRANLDGPDGAGGDDLWISEAKGVVFDMRQARAMSRTGIYVHHHQEWSERHRRTQVRYAFAPNNFSGIFVHQDSNFLHDWLVYIYDFSSPNTLDEAGTMMLAHLENELKLRSACVVVDWCEESLTDEERERFLDSQFYGVNSDWRPRIDGFNFVCEWGPGFSLNPQEQMPSRFAVEISHSHVFDVSLFPGYDDTAC